ncbi:hypothetical protein BC938DRAFT_481891, partial [Jimgerdemannia flammicorona]
MDIDLLDSATWIVVGVTGNCWLRNRLFLIVRALIHFHDVDGKVVMGVLWILMLTLTSVSVSIWICSSAEMSTSGLVLTLRCKVETESAPLIALFPFFLFVLIVDFCNVIQQSNTQWEFWIFVWHVEWERERDKRKVQAETTAVEGEVVRDLKGKIEEMARTIGEMQALLRPVRKTLLKPSFIEKVQS